MKQSLAFALLVSVFALATVPGCRGGRAADGSSSDARARDGAPVTPPANTTATNPAAPPGAPRRLDVGDMAPDFTLQASDGRTYTLSEYRGKRAVVLAWFARAFSAG